MWSWGQHFRNGKPGLSSTPLAVRTGQPRFYHKSTRIAELGGEAHEEFIAFLREGRSAFDSKEAAFAIFSIAVAPWTE